MLREILLQGEKICIPVEVIYSSRRTMGLEVTAEAKVKARVPKRTPDYKVKEFVGIKSPWILEKYMFFQEKKKRMEQIPPKDYEVQPELEQMYRKMAGEQLRRRTAYFAKVMGVTYGRITVKAAKSRWGSCSSLGNLNFHWKLALMPEEVLDYVVVHELAHRKHMNHSPLFWKEVEQILPDYKVRRKWLRDHGGEV